MTVTVYGKPNCVQCVYTEKKLKEAGIDFRKVDVTQDSEARKTVEDSGMNQLPMVVAGQETWHGFKPDKIKGLVV